MIKLQIFQTTVLNYLKPYYKPYVTPNKSLSKKLIYYWAQ